jgi:hypothetical protein
MIERITVQAALDAEVCGVTRKQRYTSRARAERAIAEIRENHASERRRRRPLPCRCYPCDRCGGWHITSREAW